MPIHSSADLNRKTSDGGFAVCRSREKTSAGRYRAEIQNVERLTHHIIRPCSWRAALADAEGTMFACTLREGELLRCMRRSGAAPNVGAKMSNRPSAAVHATDRSNGAIVASPAPRTQKKGCHEHHARKKKAATSTTHASGHRTLLTPGLSVCTCESGERQQPLTCHYVVPHAKSQSWLHPT